MVRALLYSFFVKLAQQMIAQYESPSFFAGQLFHVNGTPPVRGVEQRKLRWVRVQNKWSGSNMLKLDAGLGTQTAEWRCELKCSLAPDIVLIRSIGVLCPHCFWLTQLAAKFASLHLFQDYLMNFHEEYQGGRPLYTRDLISKESSGNVGNAILDEWRSRTFSYSQQMC